jgi:hypothetical protein
MTVDFTPPQGWGAMAFRGDVKPHDLIACSNPATDQEPHAVYQIAFDCPSPGTCTGHATKLFDAAMPTPGRPFCDGLAWDSGNDTFYMSPDISGTVYHYAFDPAYQVATLINTLPVPSDCANGSSPEGPSGNSGILVVGPDLLLACDGLQTMFEVSKADGSLVRTFGAGTNLADRAEDMECDSTTFGPDISVAWTKDAFFSRLFSFVVPPGTCGLCRKQARADLNSLPADQLDLLASLELDYLTGGNLTGAQRGAIVAEHRAAINTWHGAPQFFPGHRGYIGEFELFLQNAGHPEFVPLPRWDPATPVPTAFGGTTGANGTDTAACVASFTQVPPAIAGATACTTPPCTRSGTVGVCSGSPVTGPPAPLPSQFIFDYPGGPKCNAFASVEAVQNGGLESSYHGGAVHCGVFAGNSTTGDTTMCDVRVSPSSLIFLPWHAFVDDVAYDYECKCLGSCSVCSDLFTSFDAGSGTAHLASRGGHGHHPPPPAPANIGFWWWFEDEVVPPVTTRRFVTDHSGFFYRAEVHSKPNLVVGKVGQAIDLDGRDDYVEADDRTVGDVGTSGFTLDGWVRTSAGAVQPIVAKLDDDDDDRGHLSFLHRHGGGDDDTGYALFIEDGELGLFLGTKDRQGTFLTTGAAITDGNWHHVAAVVDREYADRSKLFVDGVVLLTFDATGLSGDATSRAHLRIGRMDVQRDHKMRHHHSGDAFFKGQLDELGLVRSALPPDTVASVFVAGSAGKLDSLGNLPTTAGQPPCITVLGQRIAALSPAEAAPLNVLYGQLLAAIAAGHRLQARQIARQIGTQSEAQFDGSYLTVRFHAVSHTVDACLDVPPLAAP